MEKMMLNKIYDLRTEYRRSPIGIGNEAPVFSYKIQSGGQGIMQKSYRLTVREAEETAARSPQTVWDSGEVMSANSACITYAGERLRSCTRYLWKVRVTLTDEAGGSCIVESEESSFETGFLENGHWKAKWIEPECTVDEMKLQPVQLLRRKFRIAKPVKTARIYQTAHGLYETYLNGGVCTEDQFKPGFTSYYKRLQYQVHDITSLLKEGENIWCAELADGWWRGVTGGDIRNNFGTKVAYLGQIRVEYADGTTEWIVTDCDFKAGTGALLQSDMKLGDVYDARLESNWMALEFDDSDWNFVNETSEYGYENLVATEGCPVRKMERFEGKAFRDAKGALVVDFGQNIAGYVEMTLRSLTEGQHILVEHGEDMKDGAFYNDNCSHNTPIPGLERFQQVDYIAAGKTKERYCPKFAIFGFQYIRITGYEGEIRPGDFTAVAVYSDCEYYGDFSCSDERVNRLVKNTRWSQKGNFMDVPTDCPTRERSPWTGDSQIYAKTSLWFANTYPFFEKWMKDVAAEQCENGKILNIVPNCMMPHDPAQNEKNMQAMEKTAAVENAPKGQEDVMANIMSMLYAPDGGYILDGSSGWGDTAAITPWVMYTSTGNERMLQNQYPSAKKWVDYMIANAKNKNELYADKPWYQPEAGDDGQYIWDTHYQWGEWLEPDIPNEVMKGADAFLRPDPEVPTAFLCYSARLASKMAEILGHDDEQLYYRAVSEKVKAVYNKYLIGDDGIIKAGRQAPHVRALAFDIVDDERRAKVAEQLNRMICENGYVLNTGFLSTALLLNTLADCGYLETAYRLLMQTKCPGWLYNVLAGATTIPEDWDGKKEHKDSMNHYSYGAVCDFLFARCAGIRLDKGHVGYRYFQIRPMPGGNLTSARAEYESPYGRIVSEWKKEKSGMAYHFVIPPNTQAEVILPDGRSMQLCSGDYEV